MSRILLVEDDETICNILERELGSWGYEVCSVSDFSAVLTDFTTYEPQLVLMDIMLPSYNGYYWCQKIRERSQVPIIFISSRSEDMDMIQAISFGADDYITKPFHVAVVWAKIQALLRRTYDFSDPAQGVSWGAFTLREKEAVLSNGSEAVGLTRTELLIMGMLLRARGGIVLRDHLMEELWAGDQFIDDNTLAVNIARLRKKLEQIGAKGYLQTKRGMGYFLCQEREEE